MLACLLDHRRDYIPYVGSHKKIRRGQFKITLWEVLLAGYIMQHSVDLENRVLDDGIIENRVIIVPRCTFFFCCRFKTFFNLFLSLQPHQFVKFTISWLVVETFRLQIGQITVSKLHCEFRRSIIELITCKTCSKMTELVFWKY